LKTLHRYITGQVASALLLTVAVAAFVVLLMNVIHDVLPLLLAGHVPLWLVGRAIALELPFACVYALPMGFITATLLVFGRFSADQDKPAGAHYPGAGVEFGLLRAERLVQLGRGTALARGIPEFEE
jgi:lipopolysaccharide export system permease protein